MLEKCLNNLFVCVPYSNKDYNPSDAVQLFCEQVCQCIEQS